jgi:phage terminase large subunit-like protein
MRPLSKAELAALAPEHLAEYEQALEDAYWAKGKQSLSAYCRMIEVPGAPIEDRPDEYFGARVTPAEHHELVIDAIQKMADGEYHDVDGIMAFMPPGSAKSTYTSVIAPSWLLGRKAGTNVISTSYGQDLAQRFGRRVRAIARSADFARIMGCAIQSDNSAVDDWALTSDSTYRASGLGGTITGVRADWMVIDDPVKNREEADSELIRNKIWDGYVDNVSTRLKPGGKVLIVMTRWHEDDLAGRLLGEKWRGQSGFWRCTDGKLFLVINLPLLAEYPDDPLKRKQGELLWPQWFRQQDADRLMAAAKKGGTMARTWSSLYQQRPAPNEGAILAKQYWRAWEKKDLPECEAIFLCYDTAFEEGEENDCSAMTAWGVFKNISKKPSGAEYEHTHIILLGAWQERVSAVDLIDVVLGHHRLFRPDRIFVEKRASGIQLVQEMQRRRLPVKPWLPRGKPGTKGKVPRAHAVAAILEAGSCWYVPGTKTEMVIDQCASFPYGTHDDLVDTVTMGLSYFRDRNYLQTADDELDVEEARDRLAEKAERFQRPRRLYDGVVKTGLVIKDDLDDDPVIKRMTDAIRRRLYG